MPLPPDSIIVGNHVYATCPDCMKLVRLTGFLARWHLCLTEAERAARQDTLAHQRQQQSYAGLTGQSTVGDLLASLGKAGLTNSR
jgi:hypothetical protein